MSSSEGSGSNCPSSDGTEREEEYILEPTREEIWRVNQMLLRLGSALPNLSRVDEESILTCAIDTICKMSSSEKSNFSSSDGIEGDEEYLVERTNEEIQRVNQMLLRLGSVLPDLCRVDEESILTCAIDTICQLKHEIGLLLEGAGLPDMDLNFPAKE